MRAANIFIKTLNILRKAYADPSEGFCLVLIAISRIARGLSDAAKVYAPANVDKRNIAIPKITEIISPPLSIQIYYIYLAIYKVII